MITEDTPGPSFQIQHFQGILGGPGDVLGATLKLTLTLLCEPLLPAVSGGPGIPGMQSCTRNGVDGKEGYSTQRCVREKQKSLKAALTSPTFDEFQFIKSFCRLVNLIGANSAAMSDNSW